MIKYASKLACFSLASVFAISANANNCSGSSDIDASNFDLLAVSPIAPPFQQADMWYVNNGPDTVNGPQLFRVFHYNETTTESTLVALSTSVTSVVPGGSLYKLIWTDRFIPGQTYKLVIEYACDPDLSNNTLYQRAWGTEPYTPVLPVDDVLFDSSFESPIQSTVLEGDFNIEVSDSNTLDGIEIVANPVPKQKPVPAPKFNK